MIDSSASFGPQKGSPAAGVLLALLAAAVLVAIPAPKAYGRETARNPFWEMPGRLAVHSIEFGPAVFKGRKWELLEDTRSVSVTRETGKLTLMIRFNYSAGYLPAPVKFSIKLPDARLYEETVNLNAQRGQCVYRFTVHNPEEFIGTMSIYLYYGVSIVDVLTFAIRPGS
jgi:hypothetical protein